MADRCELQAVWLLHHCRPPTGFAQWTGNALVDLCDWRSPLASSPSPVGGGHSASDAPLVSVRATSNPRYAVASGRVALDLGAPTSRLGRSPS